MENKLIMNKKLSILICTIHERTNQLDVLLNNLYQQIEDKDEVEVLYLGDFKTMSIGDKRNRLLNICEGEYSCYIDDDDDISDKYIEDILEAIQEGKDAITFNGFVYIDGRRNYPVDYSIKHKVDHQTQDKYYRIPNHLTPVKTAIRKKHLFPNKNWHEDSDHAEDILQDIKNETKINKILYHYKIKRK